MLEIGTRLVAALILFMPASQILARDVSREQSAVQYARQEFEKAEAEHRADVEQAARTRKALEPLKKRYEQEQKKASQSEKRKQQAKARLDKAQEALDRAWKQ
jgi:Skp family chaperone for outer membrane proteins